VHRANSSAGLAIEQLRSIGFAKHASAKDISNRTHACAACQSRRLCLHRKRINISTVLAGQRRGIKEVDDGIWLVSFMHYDLGYFDLEQKTLHLFDNPFGTKSCHPCLRYDPLPMCPGWTIRLLAEGVGFEPTVPLQARRFSRPVP
jgi:hypothetical protein